MEAFKVSVSIYYELKIIKKVITIYAARENSIKLQLIHNQEYTSI